MNELWIIAVSALWLGILTSISPCPLATNIAAVSFLGRRVDHPALVMWGGVLYTIGRMILYVALAALLVAGLLAVPRVSWFLQRYMIQLLGPILILAGMILLGLLSFNFPGLSGGGEKLQARLERGGMAAALGMGFVFAMSFCPVSAALYFGSLIPLCLESRSVFWLPALYGVGTALPVVGFAILIAVGAKEVGRAFQRTQALERWARPVTGGLFLLVGFYMSIRYIYLT